MDRLTYIGHATTLLRLGAASIVTDPILRRRLGPLRWHGPPAPPSLAASTDLVLLSHLHRDHLDLPSLRRLRPETPVVVPRGGARWAAGGGAEEIHELSPGEALTFGEIEVRAVPAEHDGHRDRGGREIEPVGYMITSGSRRVYFAGDTDLFDGMSELGPVDVALLPVWGWGPKLGTGHLDPERAAQALALVGARLGIPIHWGTLYPVGLKRQLPGPLVEPPLEFARVAHEAAPQTEVRILQPGEGTDL